MRASPRGATVAATSVSVRAIRRMLDVGTAAGLPRALLLSIAGVTESELRDPDGRVPTAAEVALWQTFARKLGDRAIGVRAGATFRVRDAGLLGYVVSFTPTMRRALQVVERYVRLFSEAVTFTVHERGRTASIHAHGHPALGRAESCAQDARMATLLQTLREITGVDISPVEVRFSYPQPASTQAHREFFRCPVHFGAASASMSFTAHDLDLPLLRADETLAGYLSKYADQVLQSLVDGTSIRHRVRATLWAQLAEGPPSLVRVARALQLSPRTLQRRLAEEGTSLQREMREIRKSIAMAALKDRKTSAYDVAFLLGYTEPSAFYRSFKRWTGRTPEQFRREVA